LVHPAQALHALVVWMRPLLTRLSLSSIRFQAGTLGFVNTCVQVHQFVWCITGHLLIDAGRNALGLRVWAAQFLLDVSLFHVLAETVAFVGAPVPSLARRTQR
jgi:hypothetical protein